MAAIAAILGFLGYPTIQSMLQSTNAQQKNNAGGDQRPAPVVTFSSGETCIVKFSVDFQLPKENVLSVAQEFGDPESAASELHTSVLASVVTVLESNDLASVRANRTAIEEQISETASKKVFSPGYVIHGVDLHDILCQSAN